MYKKTVLDNGLRVITETMPYLRSATIGIWTDIGSRNENRENNGLSHFIEHMLFKGTRTRSALDIATSLESLGGSLNAFTSRENTCYYARVLDAHIPMAAEVLSDLLSNSTFKEKHINLEKKVVLEEIKDSLDTPSDHVHDLFSKVAWKEHPLGYSILGSAANIRAIKRSDLLAFFRRNYVASNTIVAAAGRVSHARLVRQIEKQLKLNLSSRKTASRIGRPTHSAARKIYQRDIKQTHIVLGWEIVPYDHKDRFALIMLNNIMGEGMSSRMFQVIRENAGLAYSVFSFQDYYKDTGIMGIYLGCDGQKAVNALSLLEQEVGKIKTGDISDAEFSASRLQLTGNLMLGMESSTTRMNRLARNELYLGRHISINETLKSLEKVKKTDLINTARKYFHQGEASLVILGPVDKSILQKINI